MWVRRSRSENETAKKKLVEKQKQNEMFTKLENKMLLFSFIWFMLNPIFFIFGAGCCYNSPGLSSEKKNKTILHTSYRFGCLFLALVLTLLNKCFCYERREKNIWGKTLNCQLDMVVRSYLILLNHLLPLETHFGNKINWKEQTAHTQKTTFNFDICLTLTIVSARTNT